MSAPLQLAYSPCPNDTFIFGAWTQGLLPNSPRVEVVLDDVETLNQAALAGRFALTKVSYGAIPSLLPHYRILQAGGALGRACGPLLITRDEGPKSLEGLSEADCIAIPGELTTAFLLLQLALQRRPRVIVMRFDRIVDAVVQGTVSAGLIIHESRFTYKQAGLRPIIDLGEWWEATTGLPIPLGAILIRRDCDSALSSRINATIQASLRYAYDHPAAVAPYIRAHAFEMDEDVMQQHIQLYVNEYSYALGETGKAAVACLWQRGAAAGLCPSLQPEFV